MEGRALQHEYRTLLVIPMNSLMTPRILLEGLQQHSTNIMGIQNTNAAVTGVVVGVCKAALKRHYQGGGDGSILLCWCQGRKQ